MFCKSTLTAAFLFVLTALDCIAPAHAYADCNKIPSEVADYLRVNSGWKIVQFSDLVSDDQVLWNKYHHGLCPGLAVADLDGSGRKSYALALLHSDSKTRVEKLIALTYVRDRLSEHVLYAPYPSASTMVVWRAGPGKTHEWDSTKEFFVRHDSFIYELMEASAIQYYYSYGKFRTVQTSD